MFKTYLDGKPLFKLQENLEWTVLSRYRFPLTLLLFKEGQTIHSFVDTYSQATFYQCYYNLTKYIFALTLHQEINKGQVILIENIIVYYFSWTRSKFSLWTENIFVVRQALTSLQHGFLRSAENVNLHNLLVLFGKILFPIILPSGNYAIGRCYIYLGQMLLPLYEVVVISLW